MELWSKVIVEWINCLHLHNEPITDIIQLNHNSEFYQNLLAQLQNNGEGNDDKCLTISGFIENEYPDVIIDKNYVDTLSEHIYQTSLLLLSASQKVTFHKPMYSLRNDSQILIKQFLEQVLVYGKTLTFDILRESITELADGTPKTPPKTPKDRPLRNFLTSPAAQTAYRHKILNECSRELRQIKAELETERFEKMDLQEDIKNLESKIQNLHKQLAKKNEELKLLRIENTYAKTPKSCRKNQQHGNLEECLKKEIENLETHNIKLQTELNQLEEQHENLSRRLASKERLSVTLAEKISEYEKGLESLANQLQIKTGELMDLRMQNEELRAHIKGLRRNSLDVDQSFEMENSPQIHLTASPAPKLNVSEAASSIIDIQLREAQEESAKLKAELENINKKLADVVEECHEFRCLNDDLNAKLLNFDQVKMTLEITEDKLEKRQCQINILEMEKQALGNDLEKCRKIITAERAALKDLEDEKNKLQSHLTSVKENVNNLKITLDTTEDSLAQTVASKEVLVMKLATTEGKISSLEESLNNQAKIHNEKVAFFEEKSGDLEKKIATLLENKKKLEIAIEEKNKDVENVSGLLDDRNREIDSMKHKILMFEEMVKRCEEKINKLEATLKVISNEKLELRSIVEEKNMNLEILSKDLDSRNIEINMLLTKVEEFEELMKNSRDKIENLETNVLSLLANNKQLEENVQQKQIIVDELTGKLVIKISENNLLVKKISEAEEEAVKAANVIHNLEDELKTRSAEKEHFEKIVQGKTNELEEIFKNVEDKNAVISSLNSSIARLEEQISVNLKEKQDFEDTILQKNRDVAELTRKFDEVNFEVASLTADVRDSNKLKIDQDEKINRLEIEVDRYSSEKRNLEEVVNQQTAELNIFSGEFKSKAQEIINLKLKITELEDVIISNEMTLAEAQTKICELNELREELQSQLADERSKIAELMDTKRELEFKIDEITSTYNQNQFISRQKIDELNSRCNSLTVDLSLARSEIAAQISEMKETTADHDLLRIKVQELSKSLENKTLEYTELELQLKELKGSHERISTSYQEHENSSKEIINSLEKKLQVIQSSCEELKLDKKLQEESLTLINSKLEQLNKEKVESELKMKELIVNLQEVRSGQEAVIKTQSNALAEKTSQLELLEAQHDSVKKMLQSEIDKYKSLNEVKMNECEALKDLNESQVKQIQELELNLSDKSFIARTFEEKCDTLTNDLQASNESKESYSKMVRDLEKNLETEKNAFVELEEKHKSLINILESERENLIVDLNEKKQSNDDLQQQIKEIKNHWEKQSQYLSRSIEDQKPLQNMLEKAIGHRAELDERLLVIRRTWNAILGSFQSTLMQHSSPCDELKQLEAKREEIDRLITEFNENQTRSFKPLTKVLNKIFYPVISLGNGDFIEERIDLSDERSILEAELEKENSVNLDFELIKLKIDEFTNAFGVFESNMKSGVLKREPSNEDKLQIQLEKVVKEKKDLKEKLDAVRLRNVKMEKNMDELRNESKKLSLLSLEAKSEVERLETLTTDLQRQIEHQKKQELEDKAREHDVDAQMDEIDREYKKKLLEIGKEKDEIKEKLEEANEKNAKMAKSIDQLKEENKQARTEMALLSSQDKSEIEQLKLLMAELESQVALKTKDEAKESDLEERMKEVHKEYELKLEKIKQKMKKAYNEQVEKLSDQQRKELALKMNEMQMKMEQQCKKYTEDLARYKAHVTELSSQMWNVGEKLLTEQQEKETAIQRLRDLQHKYNMAINDINHSFTLGRHQGASRTLEGNSSRAEQSLSSARSGFRAVQMIEEETTTTRRHSVKSIQAMGNAFNAEDEEGEVFDNIYLADLKDGKFRTVEHLPNHNDHDRLSELRMRNSLLRPHLRSSYAVETHLHPLPITEDDLKNGGASEDLFNDSLSQSLLPGQKIKKKDRTQTSYKRPGPPTPSKNGGRLSLQGNELKSPNSRILRDRNSERRTTATPKRLKDFFGGTLLKKQDENTPATPKGRRLSSIFRKTRATDK